MSYKKNIYIVASLIFLAGCGSGDKAADSVMEKAAPITDTATGAVDAVKQVGESAEPVKGFEDRQVPADAAPASPTAGLNPSNAPSPLTPETNPEPRELSVDEQAEADRKSAEAEECTDGGGLYNSALGECFTDSEAEKAAAAKATNLEILPSDSEEEVKRKECINAGDIYNSQLKSCIESEG